MTRCEPTVAREDKHGASGGVRGEFARYFAVSVVALMADMLLLLFLANYIHYAVAATISFITGAFVHYVLSVAFVFRRRRLLARKAVELFLFVAVGVGGLVVNVVLVAICVELFAAPLPLAKLVAAGGSFVFGYVVRKLALF